MAADVPHDPIDAVYTWVDGAWPGYDDLLRRYAQDRHDLNPNRYRDNLSLLKYSLRSLARFAPWIRNVVLVTCRPQVPRWLDVRAVRVVHHDAFIPADVLPTFNSFAIVSRLDRIPGVSRRFIYIEDDALFCAPVEPSDFFTPDGRIRVAFQPAHAIAPSRASDLATSPWNRALACSNQLLNDCYGVRRRPTVGHMPVAVDVDRWEAMIAQWPEAFARTIASRFRATGNVAPEHLYPHYMLAHERAVPLGLWDRMLDIAYHPLNNVALFQRANLIRVGWQHPRFLCMNDNFGDRPDPRVVDAVVRTLEQWYPERSRFEIE